MPRLAVGLVLLAGCGSASYDSPTDRRIHAAIEALSSDYPENCREALETLLRIGKPALKQLDREATPAARDAADRIRWVGREKFATQEWLEAVADRAVDYYLSHFEDPERLKLIIQAPRHWEFQPIEEVKEPALPGIRLFALRISFEQGVAKKTLRPIVAIEECNAKPIELFRGSDPQIDEWLGSKVGHDKTEALKILVRSFVE